MLVVKLEIVWLVCIFGMLLCNGVLLLFGLGIVCNVLGNCVLVVDVDVVSEEVKNGNGLFVLLVCGKCFLCLVL